MMHSAAMWTVQSGTAAARLWHSAVSPLACSKVSVSIVAANWGAESRTASLPVEAARWHSSWLDLRRCEERV